MGTAFRELRRRRRALLLLVATLAVPLPVAAHLAPLPGLHRQGAAVAADELLAAEDGSLTLREHGYLLAFDAHTGRVAIGTPNGHEYTDLPLALTAATHPLPAHTRRVNSRSGGGFVSRLLATDGQVLDEVTLEPSADSFTVRFAARPDLLGTSSPRFFDDGVQGIDLAAVTGGFSPDPTRPAQSALPATGIAGRTPFAPPPLQIQLHTRPGWVGLGLVEVPAATSLRLAPGGGIDVDYPPTLIRAGADLGAGPPEDGMVRFPEFAVTLAGDPLSGLRAYHDALSARGWSAAASPPGSRPAWWSQPLVDTWGEQVATRTVRANPHYTADWVRAFVAEWRRRFGPGPVTVVIDSRWQAEVGAPEPDPARFGGIAGMRRLVDELHAEGDHVLLWWPMWARNLARVPPATNVFRRSAPPEQIVDPTSAGFDATTRAAVATLLGTGPDQLDADGVKLDWGYDIPMRLADPGLGWGASALLRYMSALHTAAHAVRPEALVDGSAAAPQFAAVSDAVRLYDAWNEADWNRRAGVVSAVAPDLLIDGDGYQATLVNLAVHAVTSTVYGTPAMYFVSHLPDGRPIPEALAAAIGSVVALSPEKGQGRPRALAGGDWEYVTGSDVGARSFGGGTGIVVWQSPGCGTAIATGGGRVTLPLPGPGAVVVRDPSGRVVATLRRPAGLSLVMAAGRRYTVQRPGDHCPITEEPA